jgi:quinol monooxygenase YgiN
MSVTATIRMTARPGQRRALLDFIGPALAATAAHPECNSVEALVCVEDVDAVLLLERWTTVQAHQDFIAGVIQSGGLDGLQDLLAGEMETLHYEVAD